MSQPAMNLAVIPARGGSTRIPGKAIRPFLGKPILAYALAAAADSGLFAEIHVSTDSPEVARTAGAHGHLPAFIREAALGRNEVPLYDVLEWVVDAYAARGRTFETVCLIYPAAPLLRGQDILAGYEVFRESHGRHPVVSVAAFPTPVERALRREPNGLLRWDRPDRQYSQSQDLGIADYDCAAFMIMTPAQLKAPNREPFRAMLPYVVPAERAADINTEADLAMAEILALGLAAKDASAKEKR
jgi:N-acylneuraminate cytidylyltransferase